MRAKKIILLVLLAILASSCKGEEIRRCELPEGIIPYELGQIISFIDSSGLTFDVIVIESNTEWIRESEGGAFRDDYASSEKKTVILRSEPNNLEIKLRAYIPDCCLSCKDYSYFNILVNNNWGFVLTSDREGNFLNSIASTSFYESLEINGKVYYNVVERNIEIGMYGQDISTQLFYNKTYGILQINRDGETFLTINPKTDEDKENRSLDVIDCFDIPLAERSSVR